jgi:hypothetical protein
MLTRIVNIQRIRPAPRVPTVEPMNLRLAALLGLIALVRPVLSIVGAFDSGPLAKPAGPLLTTALIAIVWVAVAVLRRVPRPVPTLTAAGVAYALFAILLNWSLQPFLASAETIPLPGYPAMIVFNALQGAVLGAIAWLFLRARRAGTPSSPRRAG